MAETSARSEQFARAYNVTKPDDDRGTAKDARASEGTGRTHIFGATGRMLALSAARLSLRIAESTLAARA